MYTYVLLILHFIFVLSVQGSRSIVSLFADSLGTSVVIIGILVSLYSLLPMVIAVRIGSWVDKNGSKKMIIIGAAGVCVSLFVPALYPNLLTLFISQPIMGVSHAFMLISFQKSFWNESIHPEKAIIMFTVAGSLGNFIGPTLHSFVYEFYDFKMTYLICGLFGIAGLILAFILQSNKNNVSPKKMQNHQPSRSTLRFLWREKSLLKIIIIGSLFVMIRELFITYFPVYASQHGFSASQIGITLSIMFGASMVIRLFQVKLVNIGDNSLLITLITLVSGLMFIILPISTSWAIIIILVVLLGFVLGIGVPLTIIYTLELSPKESQGKILGMRTSANRASQFISPLILGTIASYLGITSIFYVGGIFAIIFGLMTKLPPKTDF